MLTVGSLFSGIGGFDLGFERAGFDVRWQVEIEPFCRRVLEKRFPKAERYGKIEGCGAGNLCRVDVICAGVPCQDVSVAGKRAGLSGKRTGLFYEFARILRELRPAWFVFENVPGLLSSNHGRDFAEVLRVLMVECGYGVCWRVLDSQFFGVAQRRRRVFVVGSLGRPCPPEILFESQGGRWDLAAGRQTGQGIAEETATSLTGFSESGPGWYREGIGPLRERDYKDGSGGLITASPITASVGHHGHGSPRGEAVLYHENKGGHLAAGENARALRSGASHSYQFIDAAKPAAPAIAYTLPSEHRGVGQGHNTNYIAATLNSGGNTGGFRTEPGEHLVRTPVDADGVRDLARLPQGLDSARYRALGNAVTVPVAESIARRIFTQKEAKR
jgi:site-specific DNA-cytosine methylase